jgi:hypothetical protein
MGINNKVSFLFAGLSQQMACEAVLRSSYVPGEYQYVTSQIETYLW